MSLKHTLLGFLNYGPQTGYDLKKHMDNSTQFLWHARLSQIYPALKRMEEDAWVESTAAPQEGKPDKKFYMITDKGRRALIEWLDQFPGEIAPDKKPELLRVFFAGALDKENILTHLRHQVALHRTQLQKYQTEAQSYIAEIVIQTGLERESVFWELTRQFGEEYERMYIAWLEQAIQTTQDKL
jgi:PadR family transcriptional regulator, regulatory protein AphA